MVLVLGGISNRRNSVERLKDSPNFRRPVPVKASRNKIGDKKITMYNLMVLSDVSSCGNL